MQDLDWNDLRVVLAVSRAKRIAGAARELRIDETTAARRLARLEGRLGTRLFERVAGSLVPTESGQIVVQRAERMELDVDAVRDGVTGADRAVVGTVRITAVPLVLRALLLPALPPLLKAHPRLRIELAAERRNVRVTQREADIALRMARPHKEERAIARRLDIIDYAVYGTRAALRRRAWITHDAELADLPHARWMAKTIAADPEASIALVVNDSALALDAVRVGLGRSLLPCRFGDPLPELRRLSGAKPVLSREMWLIVHPDLQHLARIRAVIAWLERIFSGRG